MRYIIIDTWNGEGYSDSCIIEDTNFTDTDYDTARHQAIELARKHFADRYIPSLGDPSIKVTYAGDALIMDNGTDQGAIHFMPVDGNYGLLIQPDTNDVKLISESHFTALLDSMSKDKDLLGNLKDDDETFMGWVNELYQEGHNCAHTSNGYLILYKL